MIDSRAMDTDERETYMKAIKKATESKAFDRILHIFTIAVFLCISGYVVYQQAIYQANVIKVSSERTEQYEQLQISQDAVIKESASIKEYIACLKRLPIQPSEASITICKDNINGEN
ncbi:MAG: hypothetical protein ACOH18_05390 [Candidatus Saccharimonadaceae bacterium]